MDSILVDDLEKLKELEERLNQTDIFAYDTETNGQFDRFKVQLVGASFAGPKEYFDDRAYYVPVLHNEGEQLLPEQLFDAIRGPLTDENTEKVCHNAKFDEMVMATHGIDVRGFGHDTIVMSWLLKEDMPRGTKGLKPLVKSVFDYDMATYEETVEAAPRKRGEPLDYNFAKVSLDVAKKYAGDDAYWDWRLFERFKPELEKQKLWSAYENIEGPFTRVLRKMEAQGVSIDLDAIDYADKRLPEIMEEVEAEIYKEAGEVFNVGSTKQLGPILFDKLGIGKNVPKTKTGNYSTDKKTLATYADSHKIVSDVLRRKKIQKTHGTFVEGLKKFVSEDGKVHPNFNGTGTVTGRISCSKPNLQQIEGDEVEEIKIRDFFLPSEGNVLIVGDYSQIELRMMAHFSKDKGMIESFLSGIDFHDATVQKMKEKFDQMEERSGNELTPHRRRFIAKSLNFGVGYGRQAQSIAEQLSTTEEDAQQFIDNWFKTFPGVAAYIHHVHAQARKQGFIRTLSGKKRRLLPEIRSDRWWIRAKAERQAFNTKIQGCLPKDTRILTENGWTPIGDYDSKSKVWTGEKWATADRLSFGKAKRLRLHLSDGRTFDCDERHRLLTKGPVWHEWTDMNHIIGKELVRDQSTPDWGSSREGSVEDFYWTGRMIGDGHVSKSDNQVCWSLAFGPNEEEDKQRFIDWIKAHPQRFKGQTNSKNGICIRPDQIFGGTKAGRNYWLSCKVEGGSRGKRIPDYVYQADRTRREAFYQGYFDADGHSKNQNGLKAKITSVNRPLLEDTLRLMQTLGETGSISSPMINNRGSIWYDLYIHKGTKPLIVERVEVFDEEVMYTLNVADKKHAYTSEGLISKNSAADVLKIAMVSLDKILEPEYNAHMIIQIHDELVIDCPKEVGEDCLAAVKQTMENPLNGKNPLRLPLKTDPVIVDSWGKAK